MKNINARINAPWARRAPRVGRAAKWSFVPAAAAAAALLAAVPASAAGTSGAINDFSLTNLVANNSSYGASLVDPNLTNAWGLASAPDGPMWVSDNNSGKATAYTGGVNASPVSLAITVTVPGGNATGQVYNPSTNAFPVGGANGSPAFFIVDTDSTGNGQSTGQIEAWSGGSSFVVEDSATGGAGGTIPPGAIFKGLAISAAPKAGPELFATDVANATVDVFNQDFQLVSTPDEFKDPAIPAGYAPFGIQALGGGIVVTYAKQNASHTDVVPGAGLGYVDEYTVNGVLVKHLVSAGSSSPLDEPWGIALAPAGFGAMSNVLLVGNLGNGWVNAFNPKTGKYLGALDGPNKAPIVIDGLWALEPGNTTFGGTGSLVFSAGPNGYNDGLVGTITPAAVQS